jgi:hypothetical protein
MKERVLYYLRKSVEKMNIALLWIASLLSEVAHDTLTKDGKWSRTSLTMFSAWIASLFMALRDYYFEGLKYEVLLLFVGVALGSKLVDSQSKKLER